MKSTAPTARLISWKEIEGYSEAQDKESFKNEVNVEGCRAFIGAHPEFPQTEYTATKLQEWLGDLPLIRSNLERANEALGMGTLVEVEQLEPQPTKEISIQPVQAAQIAPLSEDEQESLEKLKDIPHLSDQQRRVRDYKLRVAAASSRISHAKHNLRTLVG